MGLPCFFRLRNLCGLSQRTERRAEVHNPLGLVGFYAPDDQRAMVADPLYPAVLGERLPHAVMWAPHDRVVHRRSPLPSSGGAEWATTSAPDESDKKNVSPRRGRRISQMAHSSNFLGRFPAAHAIHSSQSGGTSRSSFMPASSLSYASSGVSWQEEIVTSLPFSENATASAVQWRPCWRTHVLLT